MKITAIRLRHVKKIGGQGLALESLSDGLNVLSEPNEFGKSTVFEAFRHGLLTKHSSKKEPIKALEPRLGGGAPVVEIDLIVKGEAFRIRKQFLSQASTNITELKTGTIIKTADDAQDWIKSAIGADEKALGPTGLLWVTQGDPLKRPSQSEDQKEVFSSVLDDEVTTVVSGQRGRQLIAKVNSNLAELVTKTGRPTKAFKAADDQLKILAARKNELLQKMASAENALLRLAQISSEKSSLDDPRRDAELKSSLKAAEEAYELAVQAAPKLEQLYADAEMKKQLVERAKQKIEDLDRDVEHGQRLLAEIERTESSLSVLTEELAAKQSTLAELSKSKKAAEETSAAAEERLRKAFEFERSKRAIDDLKRLEKNLENVLQLREEHEALVAKLATMKIDNLVLRELTDMDNEVQVLDATRAKSETVFVVRYADEKTASLTQDGKILRAGESYPVHGQAVVDIPGMGQLEIQTKIDADAVDPETSFHHAKADLAARLADLGVTSIGEAKASEKRRYDLKLDIQDVNTQINRLAPDGVQSLRDDIALAKTQSDMINVEQFDLDKAKADVDDTKLALIRAEEQEKNVVIACSGVTTKIAVSNEKLAGLRRDLRRICDEIGSAGAWNNLRLAGREKLAISEQDDRDALARYEAFRLESPSLELAEANKDRCYKAIENRKDRLNALIRESEGLKGQLKSLAADGVEGDLSSTEGEIERVEATISRFNSEVRPLSLLKTTLEETQDREKQQLFDPVVKELSGLVSQVVKGAEIRLGDDYAASEIIRNGLIETVDSLSGGTQEQIAILTRLAFARLKAKQGHPTPVILDDALVFSDDTRIASMFTALNVVAKDLQIIVLTCRQKSFEGLGGNLLSGRTWPEDT